MQNKILSKLIIRLRICIAAFILVMLSLFLFSFMAIKSKNAVFKQTGIGHTEGYEKIPRS
jgi:hypothetical protein